MKLLDILKNVEYKEILGDENIEVSDIFQDSRQFEKGGLFFALKGDNFDGHNFIDEMVEKGAKVIVCEISPKNREENVSYVIVQETTSVMNTMIENFYGNPSEKLKVVGVTGTNGKTTIATMLYDMFTNLGHKSGLISTIENKIGEEVLPSQYSTPSLVEITRVMSKMVEAKCTHCFMEVSSHASFQGRTKNLDFDVGIFINLTQDHLDYHKTMEEYGNAKKIFFDELPTSAFAVTNIDDSYGISMVKDTKAKIKTYGIKNSDFKFEIVESSLNGLKLKINDKEINTNLLGKFNAYNLTAIYVSALSLGEDEDKIIEVLNNLSGPLGRMERVENGNGILGIVDYAHTPDALENVLETLNEIKGGGKIICVFGAGGDRDKTKRPLMGEIAEKYSDIAIVTSDNPRTENPDQIIEDILSGMKNNPEVVSDREEAIKKACELAGKGDMVLVAGKGHEDYQIIGTEKTHFDDKEVLKKYL